MVRLTQKLVLVGDDEGAKLNLLTMFVKGPTEYSSYVWENVTIEMEIEGQHVNLACSLTSPDGDYLKLRELIYNHTDVIVIVFSIGHPNSLKNVEALWKPEVATNCPKAPIILVGNNKDLRKDTETMDRLKPLQPITYEEGKATAKRINAVAYLECSWRDNDSLRDVFETATRAALKRHLKKRKKEKCRCSLM